MPKVYAEIPKFKRIEAALRKIALSCYDAKIEIDTALNAKRSKQEKELLSNIQNQCLELRDQVRALISKLYSGVE
jgi:hypothetical protein